MPDRSPVKALLQHPNLGVGAALMALSALAWLQLWGNAAGATGQASLHAAHAATGAWHGADLALTLAMWLLMAVAMMLPAAAPAILSFADIARGASQQLPAAERVAAFVGGYLAVWWSFGLLATGAQWSLATAAAAVPGFHANGPVFAGALLVAAGLYQFSVLKDQCLSRCRSPLAFFIAHWREGTGGALYLGVRHGVHCLGCCWALMALMLSAGAMSIAWTAALAALMLAEKVLPAGRVIGRAIGAVFMTWGGALILFG